MWQKKSTAEHRELIDLRTGMHIIPLHDPETGAEHKLQINVGHASCPHCGHVKPNAFIETADAKKIIEDEIAALNAAHGQVRAYAAKHKVPVRKAAQ